MEQKKFLTADEVFQLFGVNEEALAALVDSGAVKALANLGSFKYRSEDFVTLVADGKLKPRASGEMFQEDSAGSIPFLIVDDEGQHPKMDDNVSFLELDEDALNEQANPSHDETEMPVFTEDYFEQKSDSDVRLMTTPEESDSDVQLVSVPPAVVDSPIAASPLGKQASDSDSDVRLASSLSSLPDSDSDVQLVSVPSPVVDSPIAVQNSVNRATESDSDVRLASSLSAAPESDSDVQLSSAMSSAEHPIATSDARLDASDSDIVLVAPDSQSIFSPTSTRGENSSDQLTDNEISAVEADSGIRLVDVDSGISLESADSGNSLVGADSGISLVAADSGISLVGGDSGIGLESADSGISLVNADSGISLVDADSGISVLGADSGIRLMEADSGISIEDNVNNSSATLSNEESREFDFAKLGGDESDGSGTQTLDLSDELPNDSGFDVSLEESDKTLELNINDSDDDSPVAAKTVVDKGASKKTSRGPTLSESFSMDEPPEVEDLDISDDLDTAVTSNLSGEFAEVEEFEEADEEVFEASDDVFSAAEMSASEIEEVAESEDELPTPKARSRPKEPQWGVMAVAPIACAALFMAVTATVLWGGIATMWTGGEAPTPAGMLISTLAGLSPF